MAKHPPHILELAKRGAEVQLRDLVQEIKYLIELFPHLRDSFDDDELPLRFIMARDAARTSNATTSSPRRSGRTTSAAARKGIGERSKRAWSARRKAKTR
jgi:hypothetical protein